MKYFSNSHRAFAWLIIGLCSAPSITQAQPSQFLALDAGEVIATTEDMLLRHDLRSGHLALTFTNGERLEFSLRPLNLPDQELPAPVLNFHSGGPYYGRKDDSEIQGSSCQAEANTLQSAVNAVQSACGNGNSGSTACADAITFYQSASAAYNSCIMRVFFEQH